MQQYADIYLLQSHYMFRVSQHPSSGVLKTVTAASGTGHNTGTATSLQRGPIGPLRVAINANSLMLPWSKIFYLLQSAC
jgi:hypothetical protein